LDAQSVVGPGAPGVEKLRAFFNHPLFIEANVAQARVALDKLGGPSTHLVFTAHSIPQSMAANCDYAAQLKEAGRLVAESLAVRDWQLAYQSRSGPPSQPWLEPDVCDHLRVVAAEGIKNIVIAPIGFVSDHMEVIYDLDVEARRVASELGLNVVRAATAGTHPAFVRMIRELMLERIDGEAPRFVGQLGPCADVCPADCCLPQA